MTTNHEPAQEQPAAPAPETKVYEASWAPQDPRDRLYDSTATAAEKTGSLVRILAAFHPVLNSLVLINDMLRRLGPVRGGLLVLGIAMAIAGLWFF